MTNPDSTPAIEPIEPGWYVGGGDYLLYLRLPDIDVPGVFTRKGKWMAFTRDGDSTECTWAYIEQAGPVTPFSTPLPAPTEDTPFEFARGYDDGDLPIKSAVFQAIGAASVCWESMAHTGIFDDRRAVAIAKALMAQVEDYAEACVYEDRAEQEALRAEANVSSDRPRPTP